MFAVSTNSADESAELLRRTLDRVRGSGAPEQSRQSRSPKDGRRPAGSREEGKPAAYTGPGPDAGDPQRLADVVSEYVDERGWSTTVTAAGVVGRWEAIVGGDIAAHCRPESLVAGELVVAAESTAWATQLRLLQTTLLARIAAEVGSGVVTRVVVRGPTAPDWRHGRLRVRGRGVRDTYG